MSSQPKASGSGSGSSTRPKKSKSKSKASVKSTAFLDTSADEVIDDEWVPHLVLVSDSEISSLSLKCFSFAQIPNCFRHS